MSRRSSFAPRHLSHRTRPLVPWPHCVQVTVVVAGGVALAVAAGAAMEIACSMTLRQEVENHRSRGRNLRLYEATPFSLELRHERFQQGAGRFRACCATCAARRMRSSSGTCRAARNMTAATTTCSTSGSTGCKVQLHPSSRSNYIPHHLFDEREYKLPGAEEHNTSALTTFEALLMDAAQPGVVAQREPPGRWRCHGGGRFSA